jgi:hypothetical protein
MYAGASVNQAQKPSFQPTFMDSIGQQVSISKQIRAPTVVMDATATAAPADKVMLQ